MKHLILIKISMFAVLFMSFSIAIAQDNSGVCLAKNDTCMANCLDDQKLLWEEGGKTGSLLDMVQICVDSCLANLDVCSGGDNKEKPADSMLETQNHPSIPPATPISPSPDYSSSSDGTSSKMSSALQKRLSTLGKARECIETKRKYTYTRSNGIKEYQYLLTNNCDVDVVVSFCQWEQPAKDHLQCDEDNNGKASFARSTTVKANLTTDAASITGGMAAGACRESVSLNGNRYWLDSGGAAARVIKVGLSNGTSSGSYGCRYAPENSGTVTSR